ncbi:MAG: TIGR04282 family arsenosugar biosynthesis glycosyltransferase [Burkholderiales bacterium]|nr:TIGR04282 family arsenosugar biosynthesis glycosyltransferase [Burkholderiales bacterium]
MAAERIVAPAARPDRLASQAILVCARAPLPGAVKTRLIGALGARGAARLQRTLVKRTLRAAAAAGCASVQLWCAPDAEHPFFRACARCFGVSLHAQGEGDLGARMERAFAHALARHARAVLVGSDIPDLDGAYLRAAFAKLGEGSPVFGPAEDGGYVLAGLAEAVPGLFSAVEWGGPRVMAQTRERLAQAGQFHSELPPLRDLDRPEDLARFAP